MKLTLRDIVRMLRDKDGWRLVKGRLIDDEATYRDTGIYIYLDCGGIAFHKYRDSLVNPLTDSNIVYEPNTFAFIVTTIFTNILQRYLKRKLREAHV